MSKLVRIDAIDPHPDADLFPHDEEHVERLRADIEGRGIQTPIHLYPNGDRFTLLAGHDRLEAAKRAGLDEVPADMRSMLSTEAKRFEHFIKDNVMRKDVDKRAITKAVWLKYPDSTVQQIADLAGVSLDTSYNARNMAMEERPSIFAAEIQTVDGHKRPRTYAPREPKTNGNGASAPEPTEPEQDEPMEATKEAPASGPTVADMVREGMAMEADGVSSSEVADLLEMGDHSYRKARYVVMLADSDALTDGERERVDEALYHLNKHRSYSDAFGRVEDVVDRVFGENRQGGSPDRVLANRMAAFDRAFGTLIQACSMAPSIDIPALPADRLERVIAELREAAENVHRLRRTIEEAHK